VQIPGQSVDIQKMTSRSSTMSFSPKKSKLAPRYPSSSNPKSCHLPVLFSEYDSKRLSNENAGMWHTFLFINMIEGLNQIYYDAAYWRCDQVIVNNRLRTISLIFSNPPENDLPLTISNYIIIPHSIQKLSFAISFPTPDDHILRYLAPIVSKLHSDLSDPPPSVANDLLMLFPGSIAVEIYMDGFIFINYNLESDIMEAIVQHGNEIKIEDYTIWFKLDEWRTTVRVRPLSTSPLSSFLLSRYLVLVALFEAG
jgi:hypothetical protein